MRKIKKSTSYSHRVFAAVLAATLLFTMPGTASVAVAENVGTEDISESVIVQAEDDTAEEAGAETEAMQEPEAENSVQKEDTEECICPIGDLIAALPDEVTEGNAEKVRVQLDEILDLYRKLTEEEQEQIDLSCCLELQEALDAANVPALIAEAVEYRICDADGKNWTDASCDTYTEITSENAPATWTEGWYVVIGEVTISDRVKCSGDVHLILTDGCSLDAQQGITVEPNNSLTIYAQSGGGTGRLTATASGRAAGIGGGDKKAGGTITINGGTVTATGGAHNDYEGGAGIGGGDWSNGGTVIINGGNVTATGGCGSAPGIGGATGGATIAINGGTVTATGGNSTADGIKGTLTITGGTVNGKTYFPVTFITNNPAVTIPEQSIGEGETAARPGDPNGYSLLFFSDASYTTPFDVGTPITGSVTIYVKCEVNTNYLVSLTVNGVETKYTSVDSFVNAVEGASGEVEVRLLQDVDLGSLTLTVPADVTLTLDCGESTLTGSDTTTVAVNGTLNFTGGILRNTWGSAVAVNGSFTMSGGEVNYSGPSSSVAAIDTAPNADSITITGGTVKGGAGLAVSGGTVNLSGGTYNRIVIAVNIGDILADILEEGFALQNNTDGTLMPRDTVITTASQYNRPVAIPLNNVTVIPCTHAGAVTDNGDGTHGGDGTCPYCGTTLEAEPHTLGKDNKCEGCGTALVASVKIGSDTAYYSQFVKAWSAACAAESATVTITLLDDVTAHSQMFVLNGSDITFDGGEFTLTGQPDNNIFNVNGGKLTVTGGTLKTGENSSGISFCIIVSTGELVVTGGILEGGSGVLSVSSNTVKLSGGKFSSTGNAIYCSPSSGVTLADLRVDGCAYFDANGPIALVDGQTVLPGSVTVGKCEHMGVTPTPNNNGTHTLKCPYCGYNGTAEDCSYGTEYQHDDTYHWHTCTVCGYENKEAHNWGLDSEQKGNVFENYQLCLTCLCTKDHVTLTIIIPNGLTYGNTEGKQLTYMVSPAITCDQVMWRFTNGGLPAFADGVLPAGLPVGNHWFRVSGYMSDGTIVFSNSTYITVNPAPLTGDMVTLSSESVTYSGATQKPDITVKQGETTLVEGTDYDVTYSTDDFTNAGTITVSITGKGNYTGTVEKTYTINKAPLTVTASAQTITYGGSITQGTGDVTAAGLCNGDSLDGITLTAGTANVPGGNITPSAAGIKDSSGKDVTGNYEITYKDGSLTINKADAEITVGTDTYNKTFGDAAFTLDVTDNNTEADVQYKVTGGTDVVSVSNGTVTIKNAGTAAITVSLPASTNYNAAASRTITVNVAQKGGYTAAEMNKSYLYSRGNTDSIELAALLPKDCGTAAYGTPVASGDVTYSAAPAVNDGNLSYTLNSGNINDEGTITVTVATRNYTDITITVKVKLTDQIPVGLKDGTEVTLTNNILTYGEPLSELVFNKAEFVDGDGKPVEGTLAWRDASEIPNAGTTGATWVFTPTDKAYASVEGKAAITVNKAVPAVSAAPTVAGRVYDPSAALQDSDLEGGTVNVPGTWGWQKAGIIPAVDNSGYNAVFTPEDTTNYETVTRTITVNVTKATPYIAGLPAAAAITYGETLKDSLLSGGTAVYGDGAGQAGDKAGSTETVAGAFTWKEPSTKPVAADSNATEYTVVFTPSDTANYNSVEAAVKLTVNKAQNAPDMPGSVMSVSNGIEKVGSAPLPAGWEWQASDKDTALEVGVAVSAVAVYTGADKGNYENETVTVVITREECRHENTELRNEVTATCQTKGYSGDTYCLDCGEMLEKGTETNPTDHSGGTATCTSGKVCEVCGTEYTEKNSANHTHTEIRGAAEATCTADGYTGDTYCTDCNTKTGAGTVIPATGHTEDGGSVTKAPTETEKGVRTYKCSVCGYVMRTEEIEKLPPKPGSGDNSGSGSDTTTPAQGTKQPFIKGEEGKIGWDVIRAEEERAKEGSVINVDMNGTTVVPGDIFDRLKGRDITITFDMGSGIIWSVDGKSVTRDASRDKAGDIDFSVKTGVNAIPVDIVSNVTRESYSIQISLAYEGEFGFTAVLSINLGKKNAGLTASLYYYNKSARKLEFVCSDIVAEDGTASIAFTHASDYVIVIDGDVDEKGGNVTEPAQPGKQDKDTIEAAEKSPKTGQAWRPWWLIVVETLVFVMGIGIVFVVRKKKNVAEIIERNAP